MSELRLSLLKLRSSLITIAVLSGMLNVLLLSGSIYMMMIYDSVLPSHSIPTMLGLLVMLAIAYGFQSTFDMLRARMLANVGAAFEHSLSERVQRTQFEMILRRWTGNASALSPTRDLDSIRAFLSGPGPAAFMDMPWILFFLAILAVLHLWLAATALVGAIILIGLTLLTQRMCAAPANKLSQVSSVRAMMLEETRRHAELLHVLGIRGRMEARWQQINRQHLQANEVLTRTSSSFGGISRLFRMFLQSIVLTVGALLVMRGEATGGIIFASSIISARALAPIDQIIAHWKGFAAARISWGRLDRLLARIPVAAETRTTLPRPTERLNVDDLSVVPPGGRRVTAQKVSFMLTAGDCLGIIGTSGSGKSSVARAVVGAWQAAQGTVRLDGATLDQYAEETLGSFLGYLPQTVELLSGSVSDNISRFDPQANSEAVIKAAKAAGVHDLIVSLPQGYDTDVGAEGDLLSAGQRQRIALARALYGDPFLIVLDEPNSNLDAQGERALDQAIDSVCKRGGIVIVIAHRATVLNHAHYLLLMRDGMMDAFGPRDDVLAHLRRGNGPRKEGDSAIASSAGKPSLATAQNAAGADASAGPEAETREGTPE